MHTTVSDGVLDPVEAINIYRKAGYDFTAFNDFIAITDNERSGISGRTTVF